MRDAHRPTPVWRRYLRFRGDDVRADVDDEITFHLELDAAAYVASGAPYDRALRQARADFGDVERAHVQCYRIGDRRRRRAERGELFAALGQDFRYSMRSLRASPMHALGVVLTMGLAITALSAMFSVIDPLFVRQPPYLTAPRMVNRIYEASSTGALRDAGPSRMLSYDRYADLRQLTHAFSEMAATSERDAVVSLDGRTDLERVVLASGSLWRMFDVRPALGIFAADSNDGGGARSLVAVLGYEFWHTQTLDDPDVVGRTIVVAGVPHRIIGVAPKAFAALSSTAPAVFVPLSPAPIERIGKAMPSLVERYNSRWLEVIARRRRGWSMEETTADVNAAMKASVVRERIAHASLDGMSERASAISGIAAPVLREHGPQPTDEARVALWLAVVSIAVLVVAALNVANLMLARALRRRRELAVRLALGATAGRLMRLLFVEAVLLMTIGTAAGLAALAWGGTLMRDRLLPHVALPPIVVTGRVVAFSLGVAWLAAVGVAVVPTLHARGWNVRSAVQGAEHGPGPSRARVRSFILITQAALSLSMCVMAGLFVRSLYNVRALPLGYDPRRVVAVTPMGLVSDRDVIDVTERVVARLETRYAERDVATSMTLPFSTSVRRSFSVPGVDDARITDAQAMFNAVSVRYFDVVNTRIITGRAFTVADSSGGDPVAIVSAPLAEYLWPGESAIGRCVNMSRAAGCRRVVGVSEATRIWSYQRDAMHELYVPIAQSDAGPVMRSVLVRTRGEASLETAAIERFVRPVAPAAALLRATSMQDALDRRATSWRVGAAILTMFAVLTLVVASVGMYAAASFDVVEREREIGIRVALGARGRNLLMRAVLSGAWLASVGTVIGIGASLAIGSVVSDLLFHVSSRDPLTFVVASLATIGASLLASIVPAMRAARADPAAILRSG